MVNETKETTFVQTCDNCSESREITYSSLEPSPKNNRVIILPSCTQCSSIEFLLLNLGTNDHDLKVARIFAEVNAQ